MNTQGTSRSLKTPTALLTAFLWIFVALAVFATTGTAYETFRDRNIIEVNAGGSDTATQIWPILFGIGSLAWIVVALIVFVILLLWVHRAHDNILREGLELDHSPGWAVGSYFIPVINLFVPMRAMRELYNRSHGEIPEHAHSSVDSVASWWTAYVIGILLWSMFVFQTLFGMFTNAFFVTHPLMEFAMMTFSNLLLAIAAVMLMGIVKSIARAQADANHAWKAFE